MNEKVKSRTLFALAVTAIGVFGELSSPDLFGYGVSVEGVLGFQIFFIGLILLGFYNTLSVISPERVVTGSLSGPYLEKPSTGITSTNADGVRPSRVRAWLNRMSDQAAIVGAIALSVTFGLLWLATEYASYGLLSYFPDFTTDYAISLLTSVSFVVGIFFIVITVFLQIKQDSHRIVAASLITLISTGIVWATTQRIAYAMLVEYLLYLSLSEYIALARLSSIALLLSVFIASLALGIPLRFLRPGNSMTGKPTISSVASDGESLTVKKD
ncbi:MAG: hypothetical protein E4H14_19760 [Candidatus Thorarchaeota archaeon]|nr:MAG: hypothetical protein E4H14_19760 [Candidatus Thorarchaeota archaeon]